MKYLILILFVSSAYADNYTETNYCGKPVRNADGTIHRDSKVPREYQKIIPCPVTGLTTGACTGWAKDHVRPLVSCGCDAVSNMQWLPLTIKSCAGTECKDRWERKVYLCKPEDK